VLKGGGKLINPHGVGMMPRGKTEEMRTKEQAL